MSGPLIRAAPGQLAPPSILQSVVGLDFSHAFVNTAQRLKARLLCAKTRACTRPERGAASRVVETRGVTRAAGGKKRWQPYTHARARGKPNHNPI